MTHSFTLTPTHAPQPIAQGLRRAGQGLLVFLLFLLAVVASIPVILLFFVTAVPPWLAAGLALADVGILVALWRSARTPFQWLTAAGGWLTVMSLAVILSQQLAAPPPVRDAQGRIVPGSIATLEPVTLNGTRQWITVRGHRADLPVLLFLAGGPGGSELVMTRRYLAALEEHFLVVNWDQPGTGKSYRGTDFATLTPDTYVTDGLALTDYLRTRFGQEKIYLFGESWGSILGVWLVQQRPEWFHALVTTGQMVDPIANDREGYDFALALAEEQGRNDVAARLRADGPPPYAPEDLLGKFMVVNDVLNGYMHSHARGEGTNHNLLLDSLAAPEYGLVDKMTWLLGLRDVFVNVYPQLYDVDLRTQAARLAVPIYLVKGRWDVNAVNSLTEEYFALLDAPRKELIWFEDSAHTPSWDEPQRFVNVMVNTVLAQNPPPTPDRTTWAGYFDATLPTYLREFNLAGAAVAVVQEGAAVHVAGYGFADVATQTRLDPQRSLLHIGSAGKLFTALAVMQLVEQSKLDLDADVNTYLDFTIPATYADPITLRHLLSHTGGFAARDVGALITDAATLPTTRDYLLRNLPPRVRAPGATVGYSNYGLALLGYVVERTAGMPLGDYLAQAITGPLGMAHTVTQPVPPADVAADLVVGHAGLRAQPAEYTAAFGAGPVRSSAADMATLMLALLNGGRLGDTAILQPGTLAQMFTRQAAAAPGINGVGLGFYEFSRNGERMVGHLGTTANFHTLLLLWPERELGVFVSFNSAEAARVLRTPRFLNDLTAAFFPETTQALTPPADFAARAGEYAGTYFLNNQRGQTTWDKALYINDALTIRPTADGRLQVLAGGAGQTFTEVAPDTFVRSDGQDRLVFVRDDTGQVTRGGLSSRPVFTLEKRPWVETPTLTLGALGVCALIFGLGLVAHWAAWRRGAARPTTTWAALGGAAKWWLPLLNLAFLALFLPVAGTLLQSGAGQGLLRGLLLLPVLGLGLTLLLAAATAATWTQLGWRPRLHAVALSAAGLLFAATLAVWNLLGWWV